jgi:hypothetical protein
VSERPAARALPRNHDHGTMPIVLWMAGPGVDRMENRVGVSERAEPGAGAEGEAYSSISKF